MKSSSSTHCIVSFLDYIHSHRDKRKTSIVLAFAHLRKPFDLVDYTVAITKAINLCPHPNLIAWVVVFPWGQQQAVRYQGCVSSLHHLTCGVPYGTTMGPLCFLMAINDALNDTPHRWKYEDDSTLGIPVNNMFPDFSPLQATLNSLQAWTEVNKVSINHTKTVVIHFCTSSAAVPPLQLYVGFLPFQVVQSTRVLSTLDDQLN